MREGNDAVLSELAWDSDCFGIRVGELWVGDASSASVRRSLDERALEFDLIYVRDANAVAMSADVLRTFRGQHTDTRACFELSPIGITHAPAATLSGKTQSVARDEMTEELATLALQVAQHSRFRNDLRFRDAWVEKLYRIWIEASVARTRADEVLVFQGGGRPLGLFTIRVMGDTGNLELFAVEEEQRGKGIGRALLVAGLLWMRDHGLMRATVTTQLNNPACELYRGFGYSLAKTEEIYHLWPSADAATTGSLDPK